MGINTYIFENFSQKKGSRKILGDLFRVKNLLKMAIVPFLDVQKP